MRRPLRHLSHKLGLEPKQTEVLAEVLADLRNERDARDVDRRRAEGLYADALKAETFDTQSAQAALERMVASQTSLHAAVAKALGKLHAALNDDQRARLATLIRTDPFLL